MSVLFLFIEVLGLKHIDFVRAEDMYIFILPLTWLMFGLTVNYRITGNCEFFKILRIMSSLIFFNHMWIKWLINDLFTMMGVEIENTCFLFVMTVSLSIIVAYMVYKLSDIKQLKWIKKLYS